MDSGLARFAVLIVLFFLLTGDLAGMVKHMFEEAGYGGKQHNSHYHPQQRNQQRSAEKSTGQGMAWSSAKPSASAGPPDDIGDSERMANDQGEGTDEDPDMEAFAKSYSARMKLVNTIKESCLPKLICELTASTNRDSLTESERYLLSLIRETTISTTAEVTSKYHFAAHMGQLINGIDNTGCHNFYPGCPFPGLQVMQMMKKVKIL
ncbi:PREDICTED: uncharacterized protein LOC107173467 [Diuraphis noxia]|uniref:uncharacterized protein LOC107173467 n=1 Tax=Diuraphis noxia TaxID=143948 RepID=UPI00076361B3|nr:PREDICTED: uncharacterized protein LOC107173467 [Diuraphis noxia]